VLPRPSSAHALRDNIFFRLTRRFAA
jgi:hypothetical protein